MTGDVFAIAFPTPWPFWSEGLELDSHGRLTLPGLPEWPVLPGDGEAPPGGMAVAGGRAYFTCGAAIRVRECDGSYGGFAAVGAGSRLGAVQDPRGLAISPLHTLVVADHGNDRVQEFDVATGQLVWVWPGVREPEDVAVDDAGTVYAAAAGGVVRLDRTEGTAVVASASDLGGRPHSVAFCSIGDATVLFASVDGSRPRVAVVGATVPPDLAAVLHRAVGGTGREPSPPPPALTGPLLIRAHGSRLYLASRGAERARAVDAAVPALLGDLRSPAPAFSAIAIDEHGALWAADCDGVAPSPATAAAESGQARIGPIPLRLDPKAPHGLRLRTAGKLPVGAATIAASFTPSPGSADPVGTAPDAWIDIPDGATAATVHLRLVAPPAGPEPASQQYVELVELRIDEPGWIEHLPAVYRAQGEPAAFLDPYLRLARAGHDDVAAALDVLPDEFDPATAGDDLDGQRWLDWLATWVDVLLDERWDEATRRSMVGEAFRRHGVRGTRAGLAELIEAQLGLEVSIAEPADLARVWLLGDAGAELGFTTMAGGGQPNGSIVDGTATADRSHLIGTAEYGAPLFGDLAHRFDVVVHAAYLRCKDDERRLRELVERERPAHTTAHLCVIEPGLSLGVQSRLGIDAIVGEGADPRAVGGLEGFARDRPGRRAAVGDHGPLVLR